MDRSKLTLLLNQRFSDAWSLEGLALESVLDSVSSEWESLALSVKCNLLVALLGLRSRAQFSDSLSRLFAAALSDRDDWVRVLARMLQPLLLSDPPRPPQPWDGEEPSCAPTIAQIAEKLRQHGAPAWCPAFEAYLARPQSVTRSSFFVVSPTRRLVPLVPHADPDSLVPVDKSLVAPSDAAAANSSKIAKRSQDSILERKSGGTLRGTSTLIEKKPYQQKKTVKALTTEQVTKLIAKESLADVRRQAQPIVSAEAAAAAAAAAAGAPSAASATASTGSVLVVEGLDLLAEAQEPQSKMAKFVVDDLASLTSVTPGPSVVNVLVPNATASNKDAEAAAGLTSLLSDFMPPNQDEANQ